MRSLDLGRDDKTDSDMRNKIGAEGGGAVGEGMRHCPQLQSIDLARKRGVERGRGRGRDWRQKRERKGEEERERMCEGMDGESGREEMGNEIETGRERDG